MHRYLRNRKPATAKHQQRLITAKTVDPSHYPLSLLTSASRRSRVSGTRGTKSSPQRILPASTMPLRNQGALTKRTSALAYRAKPWIKAEMGGKEKELRQHRSNFGECSLLWRDRKWQQYTYVEAPPCMQTASPQQMQADSITLPSQSAQRNDFSSPSLPKARSCTTFMQCTRCFFTSWTRP